MPLFLTVSTLFIKNSYDWLLKRASLILIPYLFWFFLGHVKMLITNPEIFLGKLLMGNWNSTESVIWFLPALFSLNFLVFLFYKGSYYLKVFVFIVSILAFVFSKEIMIEHDIIPFGLDLAVYIFILTYLIKLLYENINMIDKFNILSLVIIILISSLLLFYFEPLKTVTHFYARVDLAQFFVPTTIIGYVFFLILNLSIFVLFFKIKSNKMLAFVGMYSFPVFLMHLIILYKLPTLIKFDNLSLRVLFMVIIFITSFIVPIIISKVLMKLSDKFKFIGLVK